MQRKEIKERLEQISAIADRDPQVAREMESQLREDFIRFVADPVSAQDKLLHIKAEEVLSSSEIEFDRSY